MRFVYKWLLGLIIFNSVLVMFAGFFTIGDISPIGADDALNMTSDAVFQDPDTGEWFTYAETFELSDLFSADEGTVTILGIGLGLTVLFGWALKSPIPIGAGLFGTFIAILAYNTSAVFNSIAPDNWIVNGLIALIGIVIGILGALAIVEMFAGQTGAD